jgi:hypothetical protein
MERPSEGSLVLAVAMAASLTAVAAASDDVPPRQKRALLEWLTAGSYRERFVAEPEVHSSVAEGQAHGRNVRTYYNPILADDLRAGRNPFRKRAAIVKELYLGGVDQPVGFSVMVKVRRRSGGAGRGWLFYETLDGTNRAAYFGRGIGVCAGCHRSGVDFLRSAFRP